MKVLDGFAETVGNTPLIRLREVSEETGCDILGKAEFLNPGSSVKDRAALFIIKDAEERGALGPGGLIVEGTAGNTGIGLALCGNARGYRTLIVIPETQSQEKKDMLRLCGAELKEVPAVPYKDPDNYVHVAERLAQEMAKTETNGVLYANQWDNTANLRAHLEGTGPEIWQQTGGKLDGFICSIGTGGDPDRDSGNPKPGEERHAPALRGRTERGPRRSLQGPRQLRPCRRTAGPGNGENRNQRRALRQPVG